MTDRVCCACDTEIVACMGFVKAGDLIELCGICVETHEWGEHGILIGKEASI